MKSEIKTVFLKDIAEIKFCIVSSTKNKEKCELLNWLTAANLLQDNVVTEVSKDDRYIKDDTLRIFQNDILIKRINPSYINYIDENLPDVYASNNLILVRHQKKVNAKYLAFILNQKIRELSTKASFGAVMPSIGRSELEVLNIPILSLREQEVVGELWHKGIEKKKMLIELAKLQSTKEMYMLNKFTKNKFGGKINDNI